MRLYSMPSSGNSYNVRLLPALLGKRAGLVDVEGGSPAIATANAEGRLPFGKAPVVELEDGTLLPESNAIPIHPGEGSQFVPAPPLGRARMQAWMFWERNQHEETVAVRGALNHYPRRRHLATPERMAELLGGGHRDLGVMEERLSCADWLADDAVSLADICLHGYTRTAGERGGFDMARFPGVNRRLGRVAALPGHVGLDG